MSEYDLWGPWTGSNAIHEPPVPRRPYPHALLVLVMVSVAVGVLFILAAI